MFSLTAVFRSLPQSTACNPLSQVVGSQPDAAKSLKIQLQVLKIAVSPRKLASGHIKMGLKDSLLCRTR